MTIVKIWIHLSTQLNWINKITLTKVMVNAIYMNNKWLKNVQKRNESSLSISIQVG